MKVVWVPGAGRDVEDGVGAVVEAAAQLRGVVIGCPQVDTVFVALVTDRT